MSNFDSDQNFVTIEILEDGEKGGLPPGSGSSCVVVFAAEVSIVVGTLGIIELIMT